MSLCPHANAIWSGDHDLALPGPEASSGESGDEDKMLPFLDSEHFEHSATVLRAVILTDWKEVNSSAGADSALEMVGFCRETCRLLKSIVTAAMSPMCDA